MARSSGWLRSAEIGLPGGSGNFGGFSDPSISGGDVAFLGGPIRGEVVGIFIEMNGVLEKVIGVSDILDGKTIAQLFMGREALSGNQLAFRASFTNGGGNGIFIATVPEPSTALLIGCGLCVLVGWRPSCRNAVIGS